jgi:hypothetical protein
MRSCFDLTGLVFGRWTVIEHVQPPAHLSSNNRKSHWLCQCQCGEKYIVRGQHLRKGKSKSCGCGTLNQSRKQVSIED